MLRTSVPAALILGLLVVSTAGAQTDPGIRPGAINGQPWATQLHPLPLQSVINNSPTGINDFFANGLGRFQDQ